MILADTKNLSGDGGANSGTAMAVPAVPASLVSQTHPTASEGKGLGKCLH